MIVNNLRDSAISWERLKRVGRQKTIRVTTGTAWEPWIAIKWFYYHQCPEQRSIITMVIVIMGIITMVIITKVIIIMVTITMVVIIMAIIIVGPIIIKGPPVSKCVTALSQAKLWTLVNLKIWKYDEIEIIGDFRCECQLSTNINAADESDHTTPVS